MSDRSSKIGDLKRKVCHSSESADLDVSRIPKRIPKPVAEELWLKKTQNQKPKKSSVVQHEQKQLAKGHTEQQKVVTDEEHTFSCETPLAPCVSTVLKLTEIETYVHALKLEKAIWPVDNKYATFYIKDYANGAVHSTRHFFVSRFAVNFAPSNSAHWVYACTCVKSEHSLISNLSNYSDIFYEDFLFEVKYCLHIQAASSMLKQFDELNNINPSNTFEDHQYSSQLVSAETSEIAEGLFTIPFDDSICCRSNEGYAIVQVECGRIKCGTCKHGTTSCSHAEHVKRNLLADERPDTLDILHDKYLVPGVSNDMPFTSYKPKLISSKKIPYKLQESNMEVLNQKDEIRFQLDEFMVAKLQTQYKCSCGASKHSQIPHEKAVVITSNKIYEAETYKSVCSSCHSIIYYDGYESCLINLGKYLVSWEILRSFMNHFLFGSTTMSTFYEVLLRQHSDHGFLYSKKCFTYYRFRWAWYGFLSLLDVDFDSAFSCEQCQGDIVICDATTLSFRRDLLSWKEFMSQPVTITKPIKYDRHRYKRRMLFQDESLRKEVFSFALSKKGLPKVDFFTLINSLTKLHPEVASFINDISEPVGEYRRCPSVWCEFLSHIATKSPMCALIHPSSIQIIQKFKNGNITKDVTSLRVLQEQIPLFYNVIQLQEDFHASFFHLLDKMVLIAQAPFLENDQRIGDGESACSDLSYFPQMPVVRERGIYVPDKIGHKGNCNKWSSGHPTLLPGIFTAYCPHGKCYGFEVMKFHESPNVPFSFLKTRFPKAPGTVIYDNACNLHTYALNRDPLFFKETWFLVDSLHWRNHKECSLGYCLKKYPQLQSVNSQVVEQSNSLLKRIQGMVSYMNQENFMMHIKLYLWARNMGFPKY